MIESYDVDRVRKQKDFLLSFNCLKMGTLKTEKKKNFPSEI